VQVWTPSTPGEAPRGATNSSRVTPQLQLDVAGVGQRQKQPAAGSAYCETSFRMQRQVAKPLPLHCTTRFWMAAGGQQLDGMQRRKVLLPCTIHPFLLWPLGQTPRADAACTAVT
jgi:hypothetical protein